jgi:hypothetical protein
MMPNPMNRSAPQRPTRELVISVVREAGSTRPNCPASNAQPTGS